MKYQNIINWLNNTNNYTSKFRTKNCVEVNHYACGTYNKKLSNKVKEPNAEVKFLLLQGCFIPVKGTITVVGQGSDGAGIAAGRNNKQVIFKNCTSFTGFINK